MAEEKMESSYSNENSDGFGGSIKFEHREVLRMYGFSALNNWFLYSIKDAWNLSDKQAVFVRDRVIEKINNSFDHVHNPRGINKYAEVMAKDFNQRMPLAEFNEKHNLSLPQFVIPEADVA